MLYYILAVTKNVTNQPPFNSIHGWQYQNKEVFNAYHS